MPLGIDLNSDSGESFGSWRMGDDAAMMGIVSSANIACGFHAGDPLTMRATCKAAVKNGVAIGAHVSYPDLAGFGRRYMEMEQGELINAVLYQMGALDAVVRASGGKISYVKPHGGLYNALVHHDRQADAVVQALVEFGGVLPVLCLPHSAIGQAARRAGVPVVHEAFADRGYTPEGTLVPRSQPGAVINDPQHVAERVLRMVLEGTVEAVDGSTVRIDAQSVCVHGDTPGAVGLARGVREVLLAEGVKISPFVTL